MKIHCVFIFLLLRAKTDYPDAFQASGQSVVALSERVRGVPLDRMLEREMGNGRLES